MKTLVLFLSAAIVTLSAAGARADWTAKVRVRIIVGAKSESMARGVIFVKKQFFRIDLGPPILTTTLADAEAKKMWILSQTRRMTHEVDIRGNESDFPVCDATKLDECLKKLDYKKTGEEKLGDHECDILTSEFVDTDGKRIIRKLWRPRKLREVAALKIVTYGDRGVLAETVIEKLWQTRQNAGLFQLPPEFRHKKVR